MLTHTLRQLWRQKGSATRWRYHGIARCTAQALACRASRCCTTSAPGSGAGLDGVTLVRTKADADRVVSIMRRLPASRVHAWDTEVADIDAQAQSPVGNGNVVCAALYSGPDVDYGSGPRVWIDNMDDAKDVLLTFQGVLQDENVLKVWHNYGFDRHVLFNHGIDARGLAADTMHMARLWDTARLRRGGYSLESLSGDVLGKRKVPMRELFARPKIKKDGSPGKERVLPSVSEIQRDSGTREEWIRYSTFDAEVTWHLYGALKQRLQQQHWVGERSMLDFYTTYWLPFAECLTDMERAGIYVDVKEHLPAAERKALLDRSEAEAKFISWITTFCPDAARMNVASDVQKAHILFAPCQRVKPGAWRGSGARRKTPAAASAPAPAPAPAADPPKRPRAKRAPAVVDVEMDDAAPVTATPRPAAPRALAHPLLAKTLTGQPAPSGANFDLPLSLRGIPASSAPMTSSRQGNTHGVPDGSAKGSSIRKVATQSAASSAKPATPARWRRGGYATSDSDSDMVALAAATVDDLDLEPEDDGEKIYYGVDSDDDLADADGRRRSITPARVQAVAEAALAALDDASESKLTRESDAWPAVRVFKIDNTENYIEPGKKVAKKQRDLRLFGLGIPAVARTEAGWPAVNSTVLRSLAGKTDGAEPKYGIAYDYFGSGDAGKAACEALSALYRVSTIDTMLSNFIVPLQTLADPHSRVHCSLNLNTETGRLSARRPSLQNQPALEKDKYGVRKAFQASPGNKLVVADYGQLELRLLAHMARCKSMIDAFAAGGDFHSRTAMGMYSHVSAAVNGGTCLLEWDEDKNGAPPAPLLKNMFANERRKAKILNFSIAYGKTAMGLSRDWNVSLGEARDTVDKWYSDRPEVRDWQKRVLDAARREGATRTLLGRYRHLPDINARDLRSRGHAERAAINTPIQGGAADVAMSAMLKLWRNPRLKTLGWKMLLQIHDEIILEGPAESADEAFQLTVADMRLPFDRPLLVDLVVDAKIVDNWYAAK